MADKIVTILLEVLKLFLQKKYNDTAIWYNFLAFKDQWKSTHSVSADLAKSYQSVDDQIKEYKKERQG